MAPGSEGQKISKHFTRRPFPQTKHTQIIGPRTYPARKREVVRIATSVEDPNSAAMGAVAADGAEEANVTLTVRREVNIVIAHLRRYDQFWGLSGSFGNQSTLFGSTGLSSICIGCPFSERVYH